ncbi:MAG: NitT/TauT family transport system permease protein [Bradyrhizobium sp.]|nr:NitT/TauT family transport system permease protein [Bradyrhizobium sp.]
MPSARCSMLDRAETPDASSQAGRDTEVRPVAFRGGGFTPRVGRHAGWIALVLVIGLWQLAGSSGWINPLFLPPPSAIARAI